MANIVLTRSNKNPILAPNATTDQWWEAKCIFNPGVTVKDGKIYVLYRAMGEVHYSTFGLAVLSDPETVEKRFENPVYEPDENNPYEEFGVEDARITKLDNTYYIVYNGPSIYHEGTKKVNSWDHMHVPWRLRCCLAQTDDFITYKRFGVILPDIDSKDGVLFPEKINGKYALIHRIFPHIWISYSDSIAYFEKGEVLCTKSDTGWDSERIGAGGVPIKTDLGWLLFYHGVEKFEDGSFKYSLGILLLDLEDPKKILYRSKKPIFWPETEYENIGYVNNVVFSCGDIEWEGRYYVYYGAADSRIGVASIDKEELLSYLAKQINKKHEDNKRCFA